MKTSQLLILGLIILSLSAGGGYWFLSQSASQEDSGTSQVAQWREEQEQQKQEETQEEGQANAPEASPPVLESAPSSESQAPENLYFDGKILQLSLDILLENKLTGQLYQATYDQDRAGLTLGGVVRVVYQEETAPGVIQALSIKQTGQEPDTIGAYVGALREEGCADVVSFDLTEITNLTPAEKEALRFRIASTFPHAEVHTKTLEELIAQGEPTSWVEYEYQSYTQRWTRGELVQLSNGELYDYATGSWVKTSQQFGVSIWYPVFTMVVIYSANLNSATGAYTVAYHDSAG